MDETKYRLVYSDDPNKQTAGQNLRAPGTGKALIRLEKRRGKAVTVIERLAISDDDLQALLKEFKQKCACGGTVKEHHLELQGDFREKVAPLLKQRGYRV